MSSSCALARSVDALQALVAQLTVRVAFLEGRVAALEGAESSWDAVSEVPPSVAPAPFDSTQPAASAAPAARARPTGLSLLPPLVQASLRAPFVLHLDLRLILPTQYGAACWLRSWALSSGELLLGSTCKLLGGLGSTCVAAFTLPLLILRAGTCSPRGSSAPTPRQPPSASGDPP